VGGDRLREGGDCGAADLVGPNHSRVAAAHASLAALAPSLTAGVDGCGARFSAEAYTRRCYIGSHACWLEENLRVTNRIPLRY
jgi:hypothetical protein